MVNKNVLKDFNKLTCKPGDTQAWKSQVGYQDTTPYNNPDVQVVACGSAGAGQWGKFALDVAKVKGTVVVSVAQDGVVRVISSRDEGRSFTPAVVAFDAAEYPELALTRRAPVRLLALGERLLLLGGPVKGNDSYPVLASDDQGVSFRAP